jgi:hypothetical protein
MLNPERRIAECEQRAAVIGAGAEFVFTYKADEYC